MRCPFCGFIDQKVIDSRVAREGGAIRRRRECFGCGRRFTTFEEPDSPRLFVVKRGGAREEFSREKCLNSMLVACRKRPVGIEHLKEAALRVERSLFQDFEDEVTTATIGELVMETLRELDTVAYVRFASVYREFGSPEDFAEILDQCAQPSDPEAALLPR